MEHFRVNIEERVKVFHAETGEWPAFKRDPYGRGLTMGTQAEIDQLPRRTSAHGPNAIKTEASPGVDS